jgi:hypothetical protein
MNAAEIQRAGVQRLIAKTDAALPLPRGALELDEGTEPPKDELVAIDVAALAAKTPSKPAFIIPEWLPEGEVALIAADGGTGKSSILLHLVVCAALERPWHGLSVRGMPATFVSFEDKPATIHWRLSRICAAMGVRIADLVGRLELLDGTEAVEPWYARRQFGGTAPTYAYSRALERIGSDRLVVIDGAADVFAGDENARAEVKAFIRALRRLAGLRGAVLLITHVDKKAAMSPEDAQGYSGSTAWNNSVRCRWYGWRERDEGGTDTGVVRLEVRKSNLGPAGASLDLVYDPAAHIFVRANEIPSAASPTAPIRRVVESDAVLAVITEAWRVGNPIPTATGGPRTGYSVAKTFSAYPRSGRGQMSKRRFDEVVNELRNAGAVVLAEARRAGRHRFEVLCAAGQAATQSADSATQSGDST